MQHNFHNLVNIMASHEAAQEFGHGDVHGDDPGDGHEVGHGVNHEDGYRVSQGGSGDVRHLKSLLRSNFCGV